jgi:hypothetical protein
VDELIKVWLKPEYLPMFAAVVLLIKLVVVPVFKQFGVLTAADGSTSLKYALISGPVLALLFRLLGGAATWGLVSTLATAVTGLFAGFAAVGLNVSVASVRGKDVSIN